MKAGFLILVLAAAYLGFAGTTSTDEFVAAAIASVTLAIFSHFAHQAHRIQFRLLRTDIARQCLGVLPKLVTDSARLVPRLLSASFRGGETSQQFIDKDAPREDPGWWAVRILTTSAPPNSYIISRLSRPGEVILHKLASDR